MTTDNNAPADDVVARLRAEAQMYGYGQDNPPRILREAAAEIERLRAERDEVVRTRDEKIARALNKADVEAEAAGNAENDLEAAQLRIRELEDGLRPFAFGRNLPGGGIGYTSDDVERARALIERNSK